MSIGSPSPLTRRGVVTPLQGWEVATRRIPTQAVGLGFV